MLSSRAEVSLVDAIASGLLLKCTIVSENCPPKTCVDSILASPSSIIVTGTSGRGNASAFQELISSLFPTY